MSRQQLIGPRHTFRLAHQCDPMFDRSFDHVPVREHPEVLADRH
jgi:hypothetical protein